MNASQLARLTALATVFAAAAATVPAALAQSDSSTLSRADVVEQTRVAIMAGQMLPAGELISANAPVASTRTREQRKAETLAANRNGALGDYGPNAYRPYNAAFREALAASTKTRADGKAETRQAIKQNQMLRAGEAV
ncbi:MAG: hypothetical protein ACHP83_18690 [Burkholderiales bacterium]